MKPVLIKPFFIIIFALTMSLTMSFFVSAACDACTQDCPCNHETEECDCESHTTVEDGSCTCLNGNPVQSCDQINYPDICEYCHDFVQTCVCEYGHTIPSEYPKCKDDDTVLVAETLRLSTTSDTPTCVNIIAVQCDAGDKCTKGHCCPEGEEWTGTKCVLQNPELLSLLSRQTP